VGVGGSKSKFAYNGCLTASGQYAARIYLQTFVRHQSPEWFRNGWVVSGGDKHEDANDGGDNERDDGDDLHEDKLEDASGGGDDEDEDGNEGGSYGCDADGGNNNDETQDNDKAGPVHTLPRQSP